ncbi:hypothetical protein KOW79_021146 [Hemibagrus wyckioides]|uniref:Uncharacterized protein n=1 Tax=Hemibagrus wyckioides TaxID=337641 RepID=A0A9D3N579_9TELE|nr:hypothetical protein KOW79_021146 [Hemibagrus wyckioides]
MYKHNFPVRLKATSFVYFEADSDRNCTTESGSEKWTGACADCSFLRPGKRLSIKRSPQLELSLRQPSRPSHHRRAGLRALT